MTELYPSLILDALRTVRYPGTGKDIVTMGMVEDDIRINGNQVSFSLIKVMNFMLKEKLSKPQKKPQKKPQRAEELFIDRLFEIWQATGLVATVTRNIGLLQMVEHISEMALDMHGRNWA